MNTMYVELETGQSGHIINKRDCLVDGIPVSYFSFSTEDTDLVFVESNGDIYVNQNLGTDKYPDLKDKFSDLIAFHETLEYDWLKELGLASPRNRINSGTRRAEIAREIHLQVHYLELRAAKNMGILEKYLKIRPWEICTKEFVEKIQD